MNENRIYPRIKIRNMTVDISDGYGFYSGFISDLSQSGLCLQQISIVFDDEMKYFHIVVSKKEANFRLQVRPRWNSCNGQTKDIGVRIVSPPSDWKQYVKTLH